MSLQSTSCRRCSAACQVEALRHGARCCTSCLNCTPGGVALAAVPAACPEEVQRRGACSGSSQAVKVRLRTLHQAAGQAALLTALHHQRLSLVHAARTSHSSAPPGLVRPCTLLQACLPPESPSCLSSPLSLGEPGSVSPQHHHIEHRPDHCSHNSNSARARSSRDRQGLRSTPVTRRKLRPSR